MDEKSKKVYSEYVEKITPTHNVWLQMLKAYIVGGIICVIGQGIGHFSTAVLKVDNDTASTYTSLGLILLSVILTALNIFPRIVKFGGCKIFTIAGPVILYGIFSSWLLGIIYWAFKVLKIMWT